ncbi:MAG: succinate dehydrogenase, hydrophobic membrane anchor protein [Gammaproteobacteria bacterium]|jgi:succinate dehydrogenase / fumarate reductase membrane anchor subunit
MNLRTPLKTARGLGAAKDGTGHWVAQRVTAIALAFFVVWLVISLLSLVGADRAAVAAWMGTPWVSLLLLLFIYSLFRHSWLGLQMVVEDYVHTPWLKVTTLLVIQFINILLAAAAGLAVLHTAFGG